MNSKFYFLRFDKDDAECIEAKTLLAARGLHVNCIPFRGLDEPSLIVNDVSGSGKLIPDTTIEGLERIKQYLEKIAA